jgi:hypothetical protein
VKEKFKKKKHSRSLAFKFMYIKFYFYARLRLYKQAALFADDANESNSALQNLNKAQKENILVPAY